MILRILGTTMFFVCCIGGIAAALMQQAGLAMMALLLTFVGAAIDKAGYDQLQKRWEQ